MRRRSARRCCSPPASGADACCGDGPYAREVAEAIPRIEKATGLKFKTPPKIEVRTQGAGARLPPQEVRRGDAGRASSRAKRRRTSCSASSPTRWTCATFLLRVLTEQVVGYYDPATKMLYVVNGADEQIVGITITHELVHALQDQYVEPRLAPEGDGTDNDRLAAAQALIEGEAQFEQLAIMLGGAENIATRLPGGVGSHPREDSQPTERRCRSSRRRRWSSRSRCSFPYLSGAEFVQRVKEKKGKANLFTDIPRSTEQVLHPARLPRHAARRADDGDASRAARRDEGLRERHGRVRHAARRSTAT